MKLDAGKLDRSVILLSKTVAQDEVGQPIETWTPFATVRAQRLELRTADIQRAAGRQANATGRFLIRWREGLSTDMRVRVDGSDFNVVAVDEPDRRATLILTVAGI